jgi:hypothetical protein
MNLVAESQASIRDGLPQIVKNMNAALQGGIALRELRTIITRLGRGNRLPHWYEGLERNGTLPNMDGKSLGSVLEMVFVAVLEKHHLYSTPLVPLKINPAKGIDIPALQLGVKSPSENYCTSEPFYSAYERLVGNEHDAVILLTDYQEQKKKPQPRIQVIDQAYLTGSQIADKGLCVVAKRCRDILKDTHMSELKKIARFLAYVNQSDMEAKMIVSLLLSDWDEEGLTLAVSNAIRLFEKKNALREKKGDELYPLECREHIRAVLNVKPHWQGLVIAADNWVIENQQDAGRFPNDSEWQRFMRSPLDGKIGMSLALQWRYNFGSLFSDEERKCRIA